MNKKKVIGFLLIFVGFIFLIRNLAITGAVIGTSVTNSLSILAICFLVVGATMIFIRGNEESALMNKIQSELDIVKRGNEIIMTDPGNFFEMPREWVRNKGRYKNGEASIKEIKNYLRHIPKESPERELIEEWYVPKLEELRDKSTDQYKKDFASQVLMIIQQTAPKKNDSQEKVKSRLKELIKGYQSNKYDEVDVANEIKKMGTLTGMKYHPKTQFTIEIDKERYSIPGIRDDNDLALEIYIRIPPEHQKNAEAHFGKFAASKHHRKGIQKYI